MSARSGPPNVIQAASWTERAILAGLLTMVCVVIATWVRTDWLSALNEAGLEFENVARSNSQNVVLAARDARRTQESIAAALAAGRAATSEFLQAERAERFSGGEIVDLVSADGSMPVASTAKQPVDPAIWRAQLQRVRSAREPVVGWAYLRDQTWMLPMFYRLDDGRLLVVSLPTAGLLADWTVSDARIETAVGLRSLDERILLRLPFTPQMMGASATGSASALAIRDAFGQGARHGHTMAQATETDGAHRLIAWAEVPRTQAIVMVAASQRDLLSRFWRQRAPGYSLVAVLLAASCLLLVWSRRRLVEMARAESRSRQAAEQGLETLRRMCLLARIGPWTVDPKAGRIELGPGAREIYGLDPKAPSGQWLDFPGADPAAMQQLQAARQRLLTEAVGYDLVLPVTTPEGARRWVRSTAAAICDESGDVVRIDGALQDITTTVAAQEQLAQRDRRLREMALAVSSSKQMILVTDADEKIVWCNAAFERVSGYALHEIQGQRPGPLLQRGAAPPLPVRQEIRRTLAERSRLEAVRLCNFSKSGRAYWIDLEIAPVLDDRGGIQSFIGLQTDVTAEIERERELLQVQERTELATRNARIGIFERDFVTRTTRWNQVMFELTDFPVSPRAPAGSVVEQRVPHERRSSVVGALRRAIRDPLLATLDFECPFEMADGRIRWLRNQCVIERDGQRKATRMVGTLLDITLERELDAERRARAEAEGRSAAKTAFLSSMSHELRTPLNAVIGYAQIIETDRTADVEQLRLRVSRIEQAGWHLLGLIDDILDLARIESGIVKVDHQPVSLAEVVADATDLVEGQARAQGITVSTACAEAWVMGDVMRLRQVMVNLLTNAIKYNVPGGQVQVRLACSGGQAQVQVQDTGLGMTAEQVAHLYQPFNRLGREGSGVQGTGIGLTITKTLIEQMGGSIDVDSEPGVGSTFELRIPALAAAPVSSRPAPGRRVLPGESGHVPMDVLCVEDNDVNALVLLESLKILRPTWSLRHVVTLAGATEALHHHRADLVILDQNLPDGRGLDWAERMAREGSLDPAKVVLMTADVMPSVRTAATLQGVRSFLVKPFDLSVFDAVLEEAASAAAKLQPR